MDINPIVLSIPIYFLLIGIELVIQFYSKKKLYRLNDAIANISCGITQQVTNAFLKVSTIALYQLVYEHLAVFQIPNTWWSIILLVLAVDLCYYWAHRMSHEINLFWGGHVVHHQSEDYNLSVALRQGSFQVIWTFWFYLPLAVLGFETTTFLLVSALNTVYQFWIHTETIGKLPKPIEFIFNTPSHHRVHHGRNPKYIDRNHAGSLIIWDRMFGTFQEEEERPTYGITKPVNSWNPVWANLDHYHGLVKQVRQTPGWMNKVRVLFNKPGWRPKELGGYEPAPEVEQGYHKYNAQPPMRMGPYVLVQFISILALTSVFLFQYDSFLIIERLAFSGFIIFSIMEFGMLLDNKLKWVYGEYIRLLIIPVTAYYMVGSSILFVSLLVYAVISGFWAFWASNFKQFDATPITTR